MPRTKITYLALVAVLLSPMAANADIIMTLVDDGTDLTMMATGTYDNTGLAVVDFVHLGNNAVVGPVVCCYGWEPGVGTSVNYSANYSGTLTGTADAVPANVVSTTNPFFFWHTFNRITFQTGAPLIGSVNESATFFGATLASLGMVGGESITVTWGSNRGTIQTFATDPIPDPIPEPSTILLLSTGLLGLAGYGWLQRRRERTHVG